MFSHLWRLYLASIKVGDEIDTLRLKLKVIRIMNEEIEHYRDVDGPQSALLYVQV